jgi:hypothetical protein
VRWKGDNEFMPYVPAGFVNESEVANAVHEATSKLGKEVVRVRYNIGDDFTGDPAIFFRIVLTDAASRRGTLGEVTGRIRRVLADQIRPYQKWRLFPYFSFRSNSEQATRDEPEWS